MRYFLWLLTLIFQEEITMLNNPEQSVGTNTSIDCCASTPVLTNPTDEVQNDSIGSLIIATAILLRAVTALIQVLLPIMRLKAGKDKSNKSIVEDSKF